MQESSIADLAKATFGHWKKVWAHHVQVLLDPAYLADPRAEAKAVLKAVTEQVGAEKRRREPKTPMLTMRPQVSLQNPVVERFWSIVHVSSRLFLAVGSMLLGSHERRCCEAELLPGFSAHLQSEEGACHGKLWALKEQSPLVLGLHRFARYLLACHCLTSFMSTTFSWWIAAHNCTRTCLQMNGTSVSGPGHMMPSNLPGMTPAPGVTPAPGAGSVPGGGGAAGYQKDGMVPILPPSALALSSLPRSAPPSLPEGSAPSSAPHGLNLLALLQSTGKALTLLLCIKDPPHGAQALPHLS